MENVNAATLKDFVIILLALGGFAMAGWTAFRPPRPTGITPDPLRIEKLDKFATRDFCDLQHAEVTRRLNGHDADVRALYEEMKKDRQQNREHASNRSAATYTKIEAVRSELADKIDSTPERVIDTLNKLGLLNKGGQS